MLQSRALAVALILLLGTSLSVGAKAISKRHVRRDWLIIPDSIAFYMYESVNKVSPKAGQFLAEAVQTPVILEIRNFLMKETSKISVLAEQLMEKLTGLWKKKEEAPAQQ
ncbi:apovitellenin-1-like isoform X2 [Trachemys scripta elegans]|uniref:apovitellenin-1-like isoform X2 n=1 Tax=Trachemys scripta elegans TaxID=31138 RepID=UPI00155819CF|nr:apovitellenin-1-like isoform X2 [Trachemys scripta elegans]XP_034645222.1 apovitellenin-1-like isoform X2 [Trachemys scripta elegans]XP_034645227.1 apovitellenin-1-like isoform X2 [Trachemys scripta elegans]